MLPSFLASLASALSVGSASAREGDDGWHQQQQQDIVPPLSCLLFALCSPALGVRLPPPEKPSVRHSAGSERAAPEPKQDLQEGGSHSSAEELIGAVHATEAAGRHHSPVADGRMQEAGGSSEEPLQAAVSIDSHLQQQGPVLLPAAAVRMDGAIEKGIELWTPKKGEGAAAGDDPSSREEAASRDSGDVAALGSRSQEGEEPSTAANEAPLAAASAEANAARANGEDRSEQSTSGAAAPLAEQPEGKQAGQKKGWRAKMGRAVGKMLQPRRSLRMAPVAQPAAEPSAVMQQGTEPEAAQAAGTANKEGHAATVVRHPADDPAAAGDAASEACSVTASCPSEPGLAGMGASPQNHPEASAHAAGHASRQQAAQQEGGAGSGSSMQAEGKQAGALRSKLTRLTRRAARGVKAAMADHGPDGQAGQASDAAAWPELEEVWLPRSCVHPCQYQDPHAWTVHWPDRDGERPS